MVSFIDGGNWSTRRKPPIRDKLYHIMLYRVHLPTKTGLICLTKLFLPGLSEGTILEVILSLMTAVEGQAIIGTPSPSKLSAAPRIKSTCPPTPNEQKEQIFGENESKFY